MEEVEKLYDPRIIEVVKNLRLMDDDLMAKVFSDDPKATEFLLRILMNNENLKVLESHGQQDIRNIFGRSIKLDILAEDEDHNLINVEIQRADKGAAPKRARYHAAMLDSHFLEKGKSFKNLKNTYIIFITEHDIYKKGFPIYEVQKTIKGTDLYYEDDLHIMYVNGEYRGNDALGDLMYDFCCNNPDDMKFEQLATKVRYYKQETEGVKTMCKAFEELSQIIGAEIAAEMAAEIGAEIGAKLGAKIGAEIAEEKATAKAAEKVAQRNIEIAETLIKQEILPVDKIAEVSSLSCEEVLKIAENLKVSVS